MASPSSATVTLPAGQWCLVDGTHLRRDGRPLQSAALVETAAAGVVETVAMLAVAVMAVAAAAFAWRIGTRGAQRRLRRYQVALLRLTLTLTLTRARARARALALALALS